MAVHPEIDRDCGATGREKIQSQVTESRDVFWRRSISSKSEGLHAGSGRQERVMERRPG